MSIRPMIKDYHKIDRPRERLKKYGASNLSNQELLAIILRTGTKDQSVLDLSLELLNSINSINDLANITIQKLSKIKGIKEVKSVTLMASIELGRRVFNEMESSTCILVNSSDKAYKLLEEDLKHLKQEVFYVLYLDNHKRLIKKKEVFKGTINQSIAHPREVFKYALEYSASFIIVAHNHPSNILKPSSEDIMITNRLIELGLLMQINIIDHLIIGADNYISLRSKNYIKQW